MTDVEIPPGLVITVRQGFRVSPNGRCAIGVLEWAVVHHSGALVMSGLANETAAAAAAQSLAEIDWTLSLDELKAHPPFMERSDARLLGGG